MLEESDARSPPGDVDQTLSEDKKPRLKRSLTLFDATALAIGAIVGAGIFVISGVAYGLAGPAVIISIIIAGIVSSFTARATFITSKTMGMVCNNAS